MFWAFPTIKIKREIQILYRINRQLRENIEHKILFIYKIFFSKCKFLWVLM